MFSAVQVQAQLYTLYCNGVCVPHGAPQREALSSEREAVMRECCVCYAATTDVARTKGTVGTRRLVEPSEAFSRLSREEEKGLSDLSGRDFPLLGALLSLSRRLHIRSRVAGCCHATFCLVAAGGNRAELVSASHGGPLRCRSYCCSSTAIGRPPQRPGTSVTSGSSTGCTENKAESG